MPCAKQVVSSASVIREVFGYACDHQVSFLNSPFFLHAVLSLSTSFPSAQTSWKVLFGFMKVVAIWLRSCRTCLVGELHLHG
jgi:hypothetical protein